MRWPWVSRRSAEAAVEAMRLAQVQLGQHMGDGLAEENIALKEALRLRTEEVGFAKRDREAEVRTAQEVALGADALLDSIERIAGLQAVPNAGETWKEYRQRILQAFKEGAETTLFRAVIDEIGRFERDGFVRATAETDPMKLLRLMAGVDMARTLKARLMALTGRADALTAREREQRQRAEFAFSDTEDRILAGEVLDGRLPRR